MLAGPQSLALTRCEATLRRARQPLSPPGWTARRRVDREGLAALPVARLRLRPAHRHTAARASPTRPACFPVEVRDDGVYVALPPEQPHARTVSDVMVETMVELGRHPRVRHGRATRTWASPTRCARRGAAGDLTFIGIRHEGAAAFAASAYGKLTGRPAACFGIAGPGSTNLLTGLYDAKVDRAPVLAISGQVPSKVLGRGAFQDVDLTAAFADVAGYSQTVLADSDHAELMTPGAASTRWSSAASPTWCCPTRCRCCPRGRRPAAGPLGRARRPADRTARRPRSRARSSCIAGARATGVHRRPRRALRHGRVVALAERLGAPVLTTFKAKGQISDRSSARCRRARSQRHAGRQSGS